MIDDPYKVLGISQNATQDEIKKAYRRKAREYHPDLHPNDPAATQKMNEVNQAYEMLSNPEKFAAQRAQQQRQSQHQPYGGYSQTGASQQNQQRQNGYQGWSSDSGGFTFEDLFGFGFFGEDQSADHPRPEYGDSLEIQRAVSAINSRQYQQAFDILIRIPSGGRNARWYYLSAIANHGLGNIQQAVDHSKKAVQMDSNNRIYYQLYRQYMQPSQKYQEKSASYQNHTGDIRGMCCGLMAAQICCGPGTYMGCL